MGKTFKRSKDDYDDDDFEQKNEKLRNRKKTTA